MKTITTKQGDREISDLPEELLGEPQPRRPNKVAGEVTFSGLGGREIKLRPTFEAALEIEDALGGLDSLRLRAAAGGAPGIQALTTRELGVIIAAGARAATDDPRVSATSAAKVAYQCGRDVLRKPMSEFLRALVDGGRLREEDLKKRGILERLDARDRGERAARGVGYPFRRYLGIAIVELGWSPAQFWRAAVPEFWCAVDWLSEKNLETEERIAEAKAQQPARPKAAGSHRAPKTGLSRPIEERVQVNPGLYVAPKPGWDAWRERLRADHGI